MTLRKRLERISIRLEERWQGAWDDWAQEAVQAWKAADPEALELYEPLLEPLERQWAALTTAEEEAAFLARGASLLKRCGATPDQWTWFWREAYGPVLRGDRSCWPPPLGSVAWLFQRG